MFLFLLKNYTLTLSNLQTHFENIVAKGEIAHDEQFLLWPQCFQIYLTIKLSFKFLSLCFQSRLLYDLLYVRKG